MNIRRELASVADSGILEAALRAFPVVRENKAAGWCSIKICIAEICSRIGSTRTVRSSFSSPLGRNDSGKRKTMACIHFCRSPILSAGPLDGKHVYIPKEVHASNTTAIWEGGWDLDSKGLVPSSDKSNPSTLRRMEFILFILSTSWPRAVGVNKEKRRHNVNSGLWLFLKRTLIRVLNSTINPMSDS